jgi:4-hydroxy-tetrahydrodipicolinate reductase
MGKRIVALAAEDGQFQIAGAVEKPGHPDIGKDAGTAKITGDFAGKADVVMDFSLPEAADRTLDYCVKNKVGLVLGTTGLSDDQRKKIETASSKIPIVCATNMSVGMNTLFSLVGKLASMLGDDYDIEIVEQHHRFKKDAPSGSALTLAENICKATGKPYPGSLTYGRPASPQSGGRGLAEDGQGKDSQRKKGDIGIHAVRAGDIVGIHSVIFSTLGETVTLNHTAHSRDTFARGALRAASWLVGKKPGLYSMADVLGLK